MVKQITKDSIDITGDTYIKDQNENLCFTNPAKRQAWQDHYKNLLNTEFPRAEENLSPAYVVPVPAPFITKEEIVAVIGSMKNGKAPGPNGIISGMLKASLEISSEATTLLANVTIGEGKIPSEWNDSCITILFKGKGNYRGLKLTDHVLT